VRPERARAQRVWPWVLCAVIGCGQKTAAEPAPRPTGGSSGKAQRATFLWSLPVRVSPALRALSEEGLREAELGSGVRVGFRAQPEAVAALRGRYPNLTVESGSPALVTIAPFVEQAQPVSQGLREATFVIDYDQPSVRKLLETVPGEERTPQGLEAFVARTLAESTSRRFDIASRVATLKKGDCTEHAVLLTALLRASGHSARVVLGAVVLFGPGIAEAAGHAWVEVEEAGYFRRLDAALYRDSAGVWQGQALAGAARLYLPTNLLDNEGPSYATGLLESAVGRTPVDLEVDVWSAP
jgi:hypothetical protein